MEIIVDASKSINWNDCGNIKIKFQQHNEKMTDIGKQIVRYLCKEMPWRNFANENSFDLVFNLNKSDAEFVYNEIDCLFNIHYNGELKVGDIELDSYGGSPIIGRSLYMSENNMAQVRLNCSIIGCEKVFCDYLSKICDEYGLWDKLLSNV